MSETRIQVASHFTIDPAKLIIGAIQFPAQATITIAVGDQIVPQKVDFAVAFTPEQRAKIEELLTPMILEAGRTAKAVAAPATAPAAPASAAAAAPVAAPAATDESEIDLFG